MAKAPVGHQLSLPLRILVGGVDMVLVAADAYDAMVRRVPGRVTTGSKGGRGRPHRLTRFDKDGELRQFFLDRFGTEDVDRIREAAIATFGADRVPSRTAVNRFAVKVRQSQRLGGFDGC